MAPWQSRCLWWPWSSPSHCQLPQEPCGQGIMATSVTSAKALPGPIPSLRGPGPVDGAELGLGLHLGTCCCSCPGLWVFASSGSCTGQPHHRRVSRGVRPWPHRRWNKPHTSPWVNSQSREHSAPYGSRIPVILCWGTLENIRWQHRDVPGPPLEALGTLLKRQGAERCAVTSTTSRPQSRLLPDTSSHSVPAQAPTTDDVGGSL